jgi:hypothetical protein
MQCYRPNYTPAPRRCRRRSGPLPETLAHMLTRALTPQQGNFAPARMVRTSVRDSLPKTRLGGCSAHGKRAGVRCTCMRYVYFAAESGSSGVALSDFGATSGSQGRTHSKALEMRKFGCNLRPAVCMSPVSPSTCVYPRDNLCGGAVD